MFISDDYPAYLSAWSSIFGPVDSRLISSWHIINSWKKQYIRVRVVEKRKQLSNDLMNLIQELDTHRFKTQLKTLICRWKADPDFGSFGYYFELNYANRVEQWAYCYRKGLGINANNHLESMHKKLKYHFLKGKKSED